MYDAVECRVMPFKPIFSPVERTKPENGVVVSPCLGKWLRTLKNAFLEFLCLFSLKNLVIPDKSCTFALWIGLE